MSRIKKLAVAITILALAGVPALAGTLSLKEIREAGVVIQQWDTSCAAAALATVFTYGFADPVTEREVAGGLFRQTEPLKVRHRGGFAMLDLKRYAEEGGGEAAGPGDLSSGRCGYFHAPIVPVRLHGYNHYVVVKGVAPDGALRVADPAYGNRTFSREKFEAAWIDGIAFVMLENGQ